MYKRRKALFICPCLFALLTIGSTFFIWNVNVVTDDREDEQTILSQLKDLGVYRGALKSKIVQSDVKRKMLLKNSSLKWIWVDIKGTSAIVRFSKRDAVPDVYNEDEFYNIYSSKDAVITKIIARDGEARVAVGDTVLKGQLLIEGVSKISETEVKFIHASGDVSGTVWEEKTTLIPKIREERAPTGAKFEHLSINSSKFNIKLFINSRIKYQKYDIIEERHRPIFLPIYFDKTIYKEVEVSRFENDVAALAEEAKNSFCASLAENGADVTYSSVTTSDEGDALRAEIRALCEETISTERRINFGEDNSITEP
jgi:similar to stage IV sporulation protein